MGRLILRGMLILATLLLTYWALGSVRFLRRAGWPSTARWLLAIVVASVFMGWRGQ